jgi:NADH:ubiquinone oxidoreductase subunit 2 (subunit N)
VLALTSTVGLYYDTRIVVAMYVARRAPAAGGVLASGAASAPLEAAAPLSAGLVLGALTVFLIVFGVYPTPLIRLIERAVSTLPLP